MQSKIPAQELARALFELITQAREQEPPLAKWLIVLTTWMRDWDSGRLRSKKYVLAVLTEVSIFAERWLLLKQLDPAMQDAGSCRSGYGRGLGEPILLIVLARVHRPGSTTRQSR